MKVRKRVELGTLDKFIHIQMEIARVSCKYTSGLINCLILQLVLWISLAYWQQLKRAKIKYQYLRLGIKKVLAASLGALPETLFLYTPHVPIFLPTLGDC